MLKHYMLTFFSFESKLQALNLDKIAIILAFANEQFGLGKFR